MALNSRLIQWGNVFTLGLPARWDWTDTGDVVSLFREDGVGALNISIVTRLGEEQSASVVARQLAESFAAERAWDLGDSEIRIAGTNDNAISEFEYTEHGDHTTYWQVWHVIDCHRAAFITYTSNPEDAHLEESERRQIVASFRWS